ncbi:hypothetical protein P167DRAFT_299801 [Morchella conica CCBAS932]|uniref:Uncharacterized protein n=1 Tax=Morchella conica CCBAS932 TaxID=1392247 RepID=A0A3N4KGD6_9PEZI|nr:hypothetical protein P167DRAFT_299801 [Morchella conica CCBAS932]
MIIGIGMAWHFLGGGKNPEKSYNKKKVRFAGTTRAGTGGSREGGLKKKTEFYCFYFLLFVFIQWAAVFVCSFLVWQSFIHIYQSLFFTFFCSIYYKPFFSSPPPVLVWFLVVSFWFSGWVFFLPFFSLWRD